MSFPMLETSFGLNFLNSFPANQSIVFSPFSIALALSFIKPKEDVRKEIEKVVPSETDYPGFLEYMKRNTSTESVKFGLANKIFIGGKNADFQDESTGHIINDYVQNITGIQNIIKPSDVLKLSPDDAFFINAFSFFGRFLYPFEFEEPGKFEQVDEKRTDVTYLRGQTSVGYASDDVFTVAVIYYHDPVYKFVIFLPKYRNTLALGLGKLDKKRFQNLLDSTEDVMIQMTIPKFTCSTKISLQESFEKLGFQNIFSSKISQLAPGVQNVRISDGAVKASFEIGNQQGKPEIEQLENVKKPETPLEFIADHPFLFAVLREQHILSMGVFHG